MTYAAPLPCYVLDAFERYLACGDLSRGFVRCHCDACRRAGVAVRGCDGESFDELVRTADRALCVAKRSGRDRVEIARSALEIVSSVQAAQAVEGVALASAA